MRVLFTVAHFYSQAKDSGGKPGHASVGGPAQKRAAALAACVSSLLQHFGGQHMIDIYRRRLVPANRADSIEADVTVCTTRGFHLVDKLPLAPDSIRHVETDAEPPYLGYECHKVMAEGLGEYDYYCYLEDDLVIHDPLFFRKTAWFTDQTGDECVLQPNRYERSMGKFRKVYIDGEIRPGVTEPFQDVAHKPRLRGKVLGNDVEFIRPHNPHSGCFFLNARQMLRLSEQPYFTQPDANFISPLESAAGLHVMRAFKVYKPAPANASFLEVEHFQPNFISLIGDKIAPPEK